MIYLYASIPTSKAFLENLLRIKHLHYRTFTPDPHTAYQYPELLIHHEQPVGHAPNIADFIDAKYPYPRLIPNDPNEKAQLMTCVCHIFQHRIDDKEKHFFSETRNPFVRGQHISLLDLILEPLLQDPQYTALIKRMFDE